MSTRATNPRGHVAGLATWRTPGHVQRWEVQAIRGKPIQVHDTVDIVLQSACDLSKGVTMAQQLRAIVKPHDRRTP